MSKERKRANWKRITNSNGFEIWELDENYLSDVILLACELWSYQKGSPFEGSMRGMDKKGNCPSMTLSRRSWGIMEESHLISRWSRSRHISKRNSMGDENIVPSKKKLCSRMSPLKDWSDPKNERSVAL